MTNTKQPVARPVYSADQIAAMAAEARAKKEQVAVARARYQAGQTTYEELMGAAREYCALFDAWATAKYPSGRNEFGKRIPRPDPRAMIR